MTNINNAKFQRLKSIKNWCCQNKFKQFRRSFNSCKENEFNSDDGCDREIVIEPIDSIDDTHQVNEDFFKEFEIKPVVWFIPKGFFQETDEHKKKREQCLKIATVNELKNSDCNIYHPEIRKHLNSLKAKENVAQATNSIRTTTAATIKNLASKLSKR